MDHRVFRLSGGLAALCAGIVLGCAALIGCAASAQATAVAQKTSTCNISKVWHKLGPTYVEKLTVAGTSCRAGQTVVKSYNSCRVKSGGLKGRCRTKVDGLKCIEQRYNSPDQFIAAVACTKPRVAVHFTYSENI